jgi:hypothetical protein
MVNEDINTEHLNENRKRQLNSLLTTYNFSRAINFATRTQNNTSIAIIISLWIGPD